MAYLNIQKNGFQKANTHVITPKSRKSHNLTSIDIERQTQQFIARGGKITKITSPENWTNQDYRPAAATDYNREI